MSNVVLTLGGVSFRDFEVPEKVIFGGKQRIVVQNLIGGGRVVEALGIDDGNISFSGIFSGSDAVSRAQELDAARALGASLPLVWNSFYYNVIIASFSIEYCKINWIPFSIFCVIVDDPLAAFTAIAAPVVDMVANDLTAASALSGQAGVSLEGLSATSLAGFTAAQEAISSLINSGGTILTSATSIFNGTSNPGDAVSILNSLSNHCSALAALTQMKGYLSRSADNLMSII